VEIKSQHTKIYEIQQKQYEESLNVGDKKFKKKKYLKF
jgi:hypothetical protein